MTLTSDQITLIEDSFADVVPIKDQAAALFYARLFEIAPEVRPLFKSDMAEQGAKLMATLGLVVKGLRNLDAVVPVAAKLADRHVAYGVKPEHYTPVGTALLWTLGQGLGEKFTPDVEQAWTNAYGILSGAMIGAAYGDQPASAGGAA
ncbi:MAG: globin family protein [Thalassobaculaceae bacterium]|nr:globin family protein [Thalassobaculaceae bacterium]